MKKTITAALAVLAVSLPAQADFHCSATINRVLVYQDGMVNILHTGRSDFTQICNLKGDWKGVDTITCAFWTSMLQNIKSKNGQAIFYYPGTGSCGALATYGATPAPIYIGDI
jgi:hypothetical protein